MGDTDDPDVEALLKMLARWAPKRRDVRAVALVGSWAYGGAGPDSDVDVVLLTEEPGLYTDAEDWVQELGGVGLAKTQRRGAITERRFVLPSGLEVELGVGQPSWAAVAPLDEGTRRVATDGLRVVYDPTDCWQRCARGAAKKVRGRPSSSPGPGPAWPGRAAVPSALTFNAGCALEEHRASDFFA